MDQEIMQNFNTIVIYHNEHKFPFRKHVCVPNVLSEDFVRDFENDILVITPDENKKTELYIAF